MAEFEATFEKWWANYFDDYPQEGRKLNPQNGYDFFRSLDLTKLGGLTARFVEPVNIFVYEHEAPDKTNDRIILKNEIVSLRDSGDLICLSPLDVPFVLTRTSWLLEAAREQRFKASVIGQLRARTQSTPLHSSDEVWLIRAKHVHNIKPIKG